MITSNNCKRGARVLLTNPDPNYNIGRINPVRGSGFECTGIITDCTGGTHSGSYSIRVKWANGFVNSYKPNELTLVGHKEIIMEGTSNGKQITENDTNNYHSIW